MDYICIGKIVNTHGLKGEVRIISNFMYKDKVFLKNMNIYIGKDKCLESISSYRPHKQYDMICIEGYNNINDVLKYKGSLVYVNRDDIKLDDGCYLDQDLIGLNVIIGGKVVGVIKRIDNGVKQSLFVVRTAKGDCLIPYVSDIIEEINFKKGFIRIKNIKGLI